MPMAYNVHLLASNDHEDLQEQFNAWLRRVRPERIHQVAFVADGTKWTYCALVLWSRSADKKTGTKRGEG